MTLVELDLYFKEILNIEIYNKDPSKNGIQVQNINPKEQKITKVAFAVDACIETIDKVIESRAQALVVHHGLFWGHEQTLTGNHYKRIKRLLDSDIALYACHIPLDANEEVGNNYGLAQKLGLKNLKPFGTWNGMTIGAQGVFEKPQHLSTVETLLLAPKQTLSTVLPFGKEEIETVAIVSGGAEDLLSEAVIAKIDLYITGELSHESYHTAKESKINVIAGGHYNTETIGVNLLAKKLQKEKRVETLFIDVPTGL